MTDSNCEWMGSWCDELDGRLELSLDGWMDDWWVGWVGSRCQPCLFPFPSSLFCIAPHHNGKTSIASPRRKIKYQITLFSHVFDMLWMNQMMMIATRNPTLFSSLPFKCIGCHKIYGNEPLWKLCSSRSIKRYCKLFQYDKFQNQSCLKNGPSASYQT